MTKRYRRLSDQTVAVLASLANKRGEWTYGLQIAAATDLKSGSLYPILARLNERGFVESQWLEPERPGRPPRHTYRITGPGRTALREARAASPSGKLRESPA